MFVAVKAVSGINLESAKLNIMNSELEDSVHSVLSGLPCILQFYDSVKIEQGEKGLPILYEFMGIGGLGNGAELGKLMQYQIELGELNILNRDKLLIWVAQGLLTALSGMHSKNYYHMDFKPSNFVLTGRGEVYVIDFGCTKQFSVKECENIHQYQCADWRYFSPERFQQLFSEFGHFSAPKADSWAVGISLLEICLNQSFQTLMQREAHTPVFNIETMAKMGHPALIKLIQQILSNIEPLQVAKSNTIWGLIVDLLQMKEGQRVTCAEALKHPVFTAKEYQLSKEEMETYFGNLQQVQDSWRNEENNEFQVSVMKTTNEYYNLNMDKSGYSKSPQILYSE